MEKIKMLDYMKKLFTPKQPAPVEASLPRVEEAPLVQLEQVAPVEPLQSTEPVVVSPEPVPVQQTAAVPAQKPAPKKQPVANSRSQKSVPAKKKKY